VVVVIVATGNHFFLDAAAGALVAGLAAALAALLTPRPATTWLAVERTQLGDHVPRHNGCLLLGRG
jgi:membrane-associated phospholipid phosphatase